MFSRAFIRFPHLRWDQRRRIWRSSAGSVLELVRPVRTRNFERAEFTRTVINGFLGGSDLGTEGIIAILLGLSRECISLVIHLQIR